MKTDYSKELIKYNKTSAPISMNAKNLLYLHCLGNAANGIIIIKTDNSKALIKIYKISAPISAHAKNLLKNSGGENDP